VKTKRNYLSLVGFATVRPGRVRLALAGLLLLSLAASGPRSWAKGPQSDMGGSRLPDKSYMAKSALYLPVIVDERKRSSLREILLYVKDGPEAPWLLKQKAPPSVTGFEYRLPQDGEYWFNVVTIDQAGKSEPADVALEAPAVIVVLDTCGPQVDLKPLQQCAACNDGMCVKCEVRDANPNPFQTRFEYQTGDHVWRSLEPMANQPDCFCIPKQAVLTGLVKISCCDRAMNTTVKEFSLAALGASTMGSDVASAAKAVQTVKYDQTIPAAQQTPPCAETVGGKSASNSAAKPKSTPVQPCEPNLAPADMPAGQVHGSFDMAKQFRHDDAKWLMVCQPRVTLEYKIEDEGKSGIGKVEVWFTEDGGKSWDVLCEDPDKRSPVTFNLPHEGVYGVCLVATNGRGFGSSPPKAGDAPEYVVELDMTKPTAELQSVKLGPPEDHARIDIAWQADDKNLGSTPIDLYYSVNLQGPWTPIAKGVANIGKYRWYLPQEICRQVYVRLVVTDMAGNSTRCENEEAVPLDDLSRPRAVISGISAVAPQ
jgi:hypothetical protein